uniref:alpha-L-fucosidase n=1 Tax=Seonamhaeicola sp. TaxID=1912245 RepID=UPI0026333EFD
MKLKKTYRKAFFLYVIAVALFACEKNKKSDIGLNRAISEKKEYQPTWESLGNYEVPEWYKDAKLGIFIHWGPYAVPAHDSEWYPRRMYRETSGVFDYHKENWGSQEEFGYKDFIPMFRAENFDATE